MTTSVMTGGPAWRAGTYSYGGARPPILHIDGDGAYLTMSPGTDPDLDAAVAQAGTLVAAAERYQADMREYVTAERARRQAAAEKTYAANIGTEEVAA